MSSNRIGIFPILEDTEDKVVLGLDDKHLDFRVVVERFNAGQTGLTSPFSCTIPT